MRHLGILALVLGCAGTPAAESQEAARPLRVFIRAGKKTHGPGEHDHPRFLADWTELLKSRGCEVDGALAFPTEEQLAKADVMVMYAADGGTVSPEERSRLDVFLKRGGGIAVIHDAVCGNDPQWFKTVVGGAWEHGKSKFHHGQVGIYVQDTRHPITEGLSNFFMDDEIYWDLHLLPEAKVIATSFLKFNEVMPQMWVYEKDAYRAFVNIQGHRHASFSLPHYRAILLRGIAWAGKRDVNLLVSKDELASLRYPEGGPTRPDKAAEKIARPADFDLSLVLAEPDVVKPISMAWDPKGRLWAAETPQYPNKSNIWRTRPYDRISFWENGKKRVFYDQLDLVTSFVFHRDGVIVTQSPDILFLRDTDGDGAADKREVLYTGFGYGDTHATASNLRWGLDGWIYGTNGYSGGPRVVNAEGRSFGRIGNGLFRFRPDGSEIEMVCSYGSNTWGLDFSWDGEIFFTMANGSHLRHIVLTDAALSRGRAGGLKEGWKDITTHRDANPLLKHTVNPYLQIDNVGGFTAASGSTLYDGGAWPDEYRSRHFVCECTINLVHQDEVRPAGVTYSSSKVATEEFVSGTDLWFRPIATEIAPDGSVYIADFYNQAVVHNDTRGPKHGPYNAAVRPDRDHEHGRIWRLQHKHARALPAADFGTVAGLVKALEHPNRWARLTAQRLLCERKDGAAELAALLKSTRHNFTRVLCLWTLHRLGALAEADLAAALSDGDAGARKNAARIAAAIAKGPELGKALAATLDDADPRARLEKIVALASYPDAGGAALQAIAPKLEDPHSRSAMMGAMSASPVESFAAAARAGDRATAEDLAGAAGNLQDAGVAARIVLAVAGLPEAQNAVRTASLLRLAQTLKPEIAPPASPELAKALQALLGSADAALAGAALPFASRWLKDAESARLLEPVAAALVASLEDPSKGDEVRIRNLASVLALPSARARAVEAAGRLLTAAASTDLQRGVIEALGDVADPVVAPALVAALPRLATSGRELVLGQLLRRPERTAFLLGEIAEKRVRPNDLGPSAVFRLRTHPDKATARRAVEVLDAVLGAQSKAKNQIVESLWPVVEKAGDLARGKALMTENCLKCHQYKGEGRAVAPDLTGMGVHGKHDLLVQLIDPNRQVEANYVSFNVRTKSGEVFNGIVASETRDLVVLKNNEGDREIRRADIDAMATTGLSLMPEGLESLGGEAIRDILSFLAAEAGGFRVLDLQVAATASSVKGLYDPQREPNNLRLRKYGITAVEGVPFNVLDPAKSLSGNNAIVLKGGSAPDWHCKTSMPKRVEVPVGFAFSKLHVLGGIAAWGTLDPARKPVPAVKLTYHYADGKTEEKILHDGIEFSDWIRRVDVPGSKYVPNLLNGRTGQVRWFTVAPSRPEVVHHLSLESYDNYQAPTFLAMTAELGQAAAPPPAPKSPMCLIVGGGGSHDWEKWWKGADAETLSASYTSDPGEVLARLPELRVLYLGNNQPLKDPALRKGIFDHAEAGKGLLLVHASTWYNWKDWPEYNRTLVGGGSRGHEKLQEFEVLAVQAEHPVMKGVPSSFKVKDELYRFEKDPEGAEIEVLAKGKSLETGKEYPVVWSVKHPKARIIAITLGHDGDAHTHSAYKTLLKNASAWAQEK